MSTERVPTRLGPLPRDWQVMPLGAVTERTAVAVDVAAGEFYREVGIRSHGKGVFHKDAVKGDTLGAKRVFRIVPERLIFNIVFAWEGAVAVTSSNEEGMIASHRFPMFGPTQERLVDIEFLRRFFQSELGVRLLGDASPGGAGRNRTLNQKFAAEIPVPIPPLGEQRQVARILESVDATIAATQAVIDQLQVVNKAMMVELLARGLPGRHTRFKQTDIGKVPEEWETVGILDVAGLPSGQVDPRTRPYSEWPLVAPNHIESASGRILAFETACSQGAISGKYVFEKGDVVYSKIRPYLRKAWHADRQGLCSADMYPLRPSDRLDAGYLLLTLLGEPFSTYAAAVSMRTGIPKINREELSGFRFALPPLPEQQAIGEIAASTFARLNAEHACLAATKQLKSALMSVLLTGEVRVKPDPEPA